MRARVIIIVINSKRNSTMCFFSLLTPRRNTALKNDLWAGAGAPGEAPCAAPQCGNGAPALRVAQSTDFPNGYGWLEGRFGEISRSTYR